MQLISAILRGFQVRSSSLSLLHQLTTKRPQVIFAVIVLGISVDLARGQETALESVPAATGYAAFCGAFGTLAAFIGVASLFVSSLEGIVTWALDGLSSLTMLAAGIVRANRCFLFSHPPSLSLTTRPRTTYLLTQQS
jgi:hypothetical protein